MLRQYRRAEEEALSRELLPHERRTLVVDYFDRVAQKVKAR
jgi:hypothetical protein